MPANTDTFRESAPLFSTTLNGSITGSSATIPLQSVAGLPTGTGISLVIDAVDAAGVETPSLQETVVGVVNAGTVSLVNALRGVEGVAQGHANGANVYAYLTAADWNALITALLVEHNQGGTHHDITTDNLLVSNSASGLGLIDLIYPVGCIYTEITGVNPGTTFGVGTWAQVGEGQVLIGQLTGDPDFGTVGDTGGAKTHYHQETVGADSGAIYGEVNGGTNGSIVATVDRVSIPGSSSTTSARLNNTESSSNLPPFLVVYFWKRTA